MNGFINLLKPPGMTSQDAVSRVKRLLPRGTAVGHGGTLDPDAAGVLPICVGRATRLFDYIVDKRKEYIGELALGVSTDTCDSSGHIIEQSACLPERAEVENALGRFVGDIMQAPPVFSAIKRGGEALYKKARRGESVDIPARQVRIDALELICQTAPDRYLIRINCGKGVYIRSLMRDIAGELGCPGHMSFLLRTASGAFTIEDAVALDELETIERHIRPMDCLLGAYPAVRLVPGARDKVLNGSVLTEDDIAFTDAGPGQIARLYVEEAFAGMADRLPEGAKLRCMLLERD
ncbi:MAG: tRNA pseudouridine(55) synthase TruB [Clostridia bacterium]|nr:tRNA pseudouridine(55) synthase TruB [Clostridia bacterium]